MGMTLDEYLEEVDRWKQAVSEQMLPLTPVERAQEDRKALARLEAKLGHPLMTAAWMKDAPIPHRGHQ